MATSWMNVRAAKTMRKSDVLLALNDNKTDEEIWNIFNNGIDKEQVILSDYMAEFCVILTESKTPMRLSLVTEYLPSIIPARKQELHHFAIAICSNHGEAEKTKEYIESYKEMYGETKDILLEELNYYTTFYSEDTDKIKELVEAVENYSEV